MSTTEHDHPTSFAEVGLGRRKLLLGSTGAVALALIASACGSDKDDSDSTEPAGTTPTTGGSGTTSMGSDTTAAGGGSVDVQVGQLAAGLEVLAINTYTAAAEAAESGALGEVPPAVGEYVTTALAHHQEHLATLNGFLTSNGADEVTEPNATLEPVVADQLAAVKDVPGVAQLALELEAIAAQTYLSALTLVTPETAMVAGAIQIVDQQHQAILLFALGQYPVPVTFQSVEKAVAA